MKKSNQLNSSERGFTLLEVIITIVVAAILGTLLVTFMGTSITKSAVPLNQTRALGTAIGNIETITSAYASYLSGVKTWDTVVGGVDGFMQVVGKVPAANPTPVVIGSLTIDKTVQIRTTSGDQTLVSYFMK